MRLRELLMASAVCLWSCGQPSAPTGDGKSGAGDSSGAGDKSGAGGGTTTTSPPVTPTVTAPPAAGKCAPGCKVDTDESLSAHHKKLTGETINQCIARTSAPELGGAVVVGGFAHDRGCMPDGVHHACCYHTPVASSAAPILAAAGWARADARRREDLALLWVLQVLHAQDGHMLQSATDDFAKEKKAFTPPSATTEASGEVLVRGWMQHPSGMIAESNYSELEHRFDAQGVHMGAKEIDRFTHPFR